MALKTEYSCDKCGHVQPTSTQMWLIRAAYKSVDQRYHSYGDSWSSKEQMWCRKCVEAIGLFPVTPVLKTETPPPAPPSLEDALREIIREEIQERTGA